MVGKTISHYKVLDKIGEGGMGVVYKAEDTRLDRVVALKFLSAHLLENEEARERFVHEAKAAATLDHPNICTVHEIDEAGGQIFLTMPFIEGESLKEKVARRPLPLENALDLAIQISEGLHAAHGKGIVHRDIKSANVMVDPEGRAKITDFGLARLTGRTTITKAGTTLGTPAYMSPEQVQGETGDHRSDVWSLGVVLYEMVTGSLPFGDPDSQSVGHAILYLEPEPPTGLRSGLPVELDRIVAKCLAKSPEDRYHHADDLAVDLRSLRRQSDTRSSVPITTVRRRVRQPLWGKVLPWAIAAFAVAVAVTALVVSPRSPSPELPVTRALVTLPEGQSMPFTDAVDPLAISGDGRHVAYITGQASAKQIRLRSTDELEDRVLAGSEGAQRMCFSPDDRWLAFVADGQLKKVLLDDSSPLVLSRVGDARAAIWAEDGHIYFGNRSDTGIWRVPEDGGQPERITTPDNSKGEYFHYDPVYIPDKDSILFGSADGSHGQHRIHVKELASGQQRLVIEGGASPRYLPTGHLLYAQGNTVLAAPFDAELGEITGSAMPVLQDVSTTLFRAQFVVSKNGVVVSMRSEGGLSAEAANQLVWVDRQGAEVPITREQRAYYGPRLSPNGRRLLTWIAGGNSQLWTYDLNRGTLTRLTEAGDNYWSTWSPDGQRIAFISMREGALNLFIISADGSAAAEQLTNDEFGQQPLAWTPDGATIICHQQVHPETGWDIVTVSVDGDRQPKPFLNGPSHEFQPALSPDGRWLAYVSDESGRNEVYVTSFPQAGAKRVVSTDGGTEPLWNPAGGELFYRRDLGMYSVKFTTAPEFRPGMPELLFEKRFNLAPMFGRNYDVTSEGQRFLMLYRESLASGVNQYVMITNWFTELLRRVPVDTV